MGLSDHVDLSAFFSVVIQPHLPSGASGQIWEFGYSLLVMCLKKMDASRYTCFLPMWSDPKGLGMDTVYQEAYLHMVAIFPASDHPQESDSDDYENVCGRKDCNKRTKARTPPSTGYYNFCRSMKCSVRQREIETYFRDETSGECGRVGCSEPCWPAEEGYYNLCGLTCIYIE